MKQQKQTAIGIVTGMAALSAVGMVAANQMSKKNKAKKLKKTITKAVKTAEDMAQSVSSFF